MERLDLTLDLKNYDSSITIFKREAARGIIRRNGDFLFVRGKYGDYKFPSGGVELGESPKRTLVREVKEETGYVVIPDSITYFGVVHERRKGAIDDIIEMDSHYYFCDVSVIPGDKQLSRYEIEYEYQAIWIPIDEAVANNRNCTNLDLCPWVIRESKVMELLISYSGAIKE